MNRDYTSNPQYMDDDNGKPHWHKDWSPSPKHLAAIHGTDEQRARWANEDEIISDQAFEIESHPKHRIIFNPVSRFAGMMRGYDS